MLGEQYQAILGENYYTANDFAEKLILNNSKLSAGTVDKNVIGDSILNSDSVVETIQKYATLGIPEAYGLAFRSAVIAAESRINEVNTPGSTANLISQMPVISLDDKTVLDGIQGYVDNMMSDIGNNAVVWAYHDNIKNPINELEDAIRTYSSNPLGPELVVGMALKTLFESFRDVSIGRAHSHEDITILQYENPTSLEHLAQVNRNYLDRIKELSEVNNFGEIFSQKLKTVMSFLSSDYAKSIVYPDIINFEKNLENLFSEAYAQTKSALNDRYRIIVGSEFGNYEMTAALKIEDFADKIEAGLKSRNIEISKDHLYNVAKNVLNSKGAQDTVEHLHSTQNHKDKYATFFQELLDLAHDEIQSIYTKEPKAEGTYLKTTAPIGIIDSKKQLETQYLNL
ncbi:MAG: hypothetical protein GOU98_00635 [Candidatus Altiarchaeota archaeon]|nr:hypothetical protein [Candidatus Altiarchaeota archaeon]